MKMTCDKCGKSFGVCYNQDFMRWLKKWPNEEPQGCYICNPDAKRLSGQKIEQIPIEGMGTQNFSDFINSILGDEENV